MPRPEDVSELPTQDTSTVSVRDFVRFVVHDVCSHLRVLPCVVVLGFVWSGTLRADDWPQWRGPAANGVSAEIDIPIRWSAAENVAWKAALRGLGTSSPVVWGDRIFITSQLGRGGIDERGARFANTHVPRAYDSDDGTIQLLVQAFHRADGRLLWEQEVEAQGWIPPVHRKHNFASPSVVTDGELIYTWFGNGQILALTLDGSPVWSRHLGEEYAPFDVLWGHGSSPMLYRESVILLCDHPPGGYLLALDKRTGAEQWKVDRGPGLRSYSTPFLVSGEDGDLLIVNSTNRIEAYDARTAELRWHAGEPVTLAIPMPVYHEGVVYASRGYASGPYMAIRTGGRGDVSASHIKWRSPTRAPYISSLLLYDGLIYMATELGIVSVSDAETGEVLWRQRLDGVFTASPVAADGHVYLLAESGETFVLAAGPEPTLVARNPVGERTLASPAISNGQIFIRTDESLFCIGD